MTDEPNLLKAQALLLGLRDSWITAYAYINGHERAVSKKETLGAWNQWITLILALATALAAVLARDSQFGSLLTAIVAVLTAASKILETVTGQSALKPHHDAVANLTSLRHKINHLVVDVGSYIEGRPLKKLDDINEDTNAITTELKNLRSENPLREEAKKAFEDSPLRLQLANVKQLLEPRLSEELPDIKPAQRAPA